MCINCTRKPEYSFRVSYDIYYLQCLLYVRQQSWWILEEQSHNFLNKIGAWIILQLFQLVKLLIQVSLQEKQGVDILKSKIQKNELWQKAISLLRATSSNCLRDQTLWRIQLPQINDGYIWYIWAWRQANFRWQVQWHVGHKRGTHAIKVYNKKSIFVVFML